MASSELWAWHTSAPACFFFGGGRGAGGQYFQQDLGGGVYTIVSFSCGGTNYMQQFWGWVPIFGWNFLVEVFLTLSHRLCWRCSFGCDNFEDDEKNDKYDTQFHDYLSYVKCVSVTLLGKHKIL